jgi:hypothetical protein
MPPSRDTRAPTTAVSPRWWAMLVTPHNLGSALRLRRGKHMRTPKHKTASLPGHHCLPRRDMRLVLGIAERGEIRVRQAPLGRHR